MTSSAVLDAPPQPAAKDSATALGRRDEVSGHDVPGQDVPEQDASESPEAASAGDDSDRLLHTWRRVRDLLVAELGPAGHWRGELSASALSTATACFAVHCVVQARPEVDSPAWRRRIAAGLQWLVDHANDDGGWGDTVRSGSHPSTTTLCWAVLSAAGDDTHEAARSKAARWLEGHFGGLDHDTLGRGIEGIYGEDRTFSAPILAMCSLAGVLGDPGDALRRTPGLPFELAVLPQRLFGMLGLPVVSYALPALIAVGQVQHHHAPSRNPLIRGLRQRCRAATLRRLDGLQPTSGGFLEAIPLTSFVTMCLAGCDQAEHPVVDRSLAFLAGSVADDGSWPIDIDLATWVTTLSIQGLGPDGGRPRGLDDATVDGLRQWLLDQQYTTVHPFTGAAPGGWAWTDLPGGVPDADDTPGALLALRHFDDSDGRGGRAAEAGLQWLVDLQNRDGGIPTFCRGWGKLPFDRSSPDLTAHAVRALTVWRQDISPRLRNRLDETLRRGLDYLRRTQREDGSWVPLWFGNERAPQLENPTYGTAKVLRALEVFATWQAQAMAQEASRAEAWLLNAQNPDGGWGGAPGVESSMEETALAVEALAGRSGRHIERAVRRGVDHLIHCVENEAYSAPAPIGFYFANLWYFEKLYPLAFTAAALGRVLCARPGGGDILSP